jgi:hypothetical protein
MAKRILPFGGILASLVLTACGVSPGLSSNSLSYQGATVPTSGFYITSFSPAPGTLTALPGSVTVFFSEPPDRGLLGALTHYNINCGGGDVAAAAVDSVSGYASVTVTLASMGSPAAGTTCVFSVSPNLYDTTGLALTGALTASYVIEP